MILGLDSSSKTGAAALMCDGEMIARAFCDKGLTHSQTFLPMIAEMLDSVNVKPTALTGVAVTVGPGSFTGLRIGLATAQALAWPDLPCVGVSSLYAAAQGVVASNGLICACMDARRGQVYNALFRAENGVLIRLCDDRALPMEELFAEGLDNPMFIGDAATMCAAAYDKPHRAVDMPYIQGEAVCQAAWPYFQRGETVLCHALTPNYLRMSQAEREAM
ncbi:MAG: tRNA (adenosine(37)-N6)-threonylcarbamoyltransferase complex dimerization subunit type 1 TsaB [Oscillospiraceae bacterium]|nr:tRNA (adenosine(37)-N6)-threonylcarbamoyltransferase complex dimerization subunit type 1 TsaB [Oscillospiraceae bacterium]